MAKSFDSNENKFQSLRFSCWRFTDAPVIPVRYAFLRDFFRLKRCHDDYLAIISPFGELLWEKVCLVGESRPLAGLTLFALRPKFQILKALNRKSICFLKLNSSWIPTAEDSRNPHKISVTVCRQSGHVNRRHTWNFSEFLTRHSMDRKRMACKILFFDARFMQTTCSLLK